MSSLLYVNKQKTAQCLPVWGLYTFYIISVHVCNSFHNSHLLPKSLQTRDLHNQLSNFSTEISTRNCRFYSNHLGDQEMFWQSYIIMDLPYNACKSRSFTLQTIISQKNWRVPYKLTAWATSAVQSKTQPCVESDLVHLSGILQKIGDKTRQFPRTGCTWSERLKLRREEAHLYCVFCDIACGLFGLISSRCCIRHLCLPQPQMYVCYSVI